MLFMFFQGPDDFDLPNDYSHSLSCTRTQATAVALNSHWDVTNWPRSGKSTKIFYICVRCGESGAEDAKQQQLIYNNYSTNKL